MDLEVVGIAKTQFAAEQRKIDHMSAVPALIIHKVKVPTGSIYSAEILREPEAEMPILCFVKSVFAPPNAWRSGCFRPAPPSCARRWQITPRKDCAKY